MEIASGKCMEKWKVWIGHLSSILASFPNVETESGQSYYIARAELSLVSFLRIPMLRLLISNCRWSKKTRKSEIKGPNISDEVFMFTISTYFRSWGCWNPEFSARASRARKWRHCGKGGPGNGTKSDPKWSPFGEARWAETQGKQWVLAHFRQYGGPILGSILVSLLGPLLGPLFSEFN